MPWRWMAGGWSHGWCGWTHSWSRGWCRRSSGRPPSPRPVPRRRPLAPPAWLTGTCPRIPGAPLGPHCNTHCNTSPQTHHHSPHQLEDPHLLLPHLLLVPHQAPVPTVGEVEAVVAAESDLHVREDDELQPLVLLPPVGGAVGRSEEKVSVRAAEFADPGPGSWHRSVRDLLLTVLASPGMLGVAGPGWTWSLISLSAHHKNNQ